MRELIQLAERQIGAGTIQTVNARELHAFLEVGKDFSTWMNGRIQQYGFGKAIRPGRGPAQQGLPSVPRHGQRAGDEDVKAFDRLI